VIFALDGDGVPVKSPSRLIYDISGKGFTRFYGLGGVQNKTITSDLNPHLRFMIFDQEPDRERLTKVTKETPAPLPPPTDDFARSGRPRVSLRAGPRAFGRGARRGAIGIVRSRASG
jgi:hypothetical protein